MEQATVTSRKDGTVAREDEYDGSKLWWKETHPCVGDVWLGRNFGLKRNLGVKSQSAASRAAKNWK